MKGIILAAGRGSRMGCLTSDLPKCRTKFFGKDLIDWQISSLEKGGINEIAIVTGYLDDTFNYSLRYFHNKRWSETNMVMSLLEAKEWLETDDCIISYSDICYSPEAVKILKNNNNDLAIAYDPDWLTLWQVRMDDPLSDAESFKLDKDSYLTEIGNKSKDVEEVKGQYMGLVKMTPKSYRQIEMALKDRSSSDNDKLDFTSLLNLLISKDQKIKAVPIEDQWYEVDTESDLKSYISWRNDTDIFQKL